MSSYNLVSSLVYPEETYDKISDNSPNVNIDVIVGLSILAEASQVAKVILENVIEDLALLLNH